MLKRLFPVRASSIRCDIPRYDSIANIASSEYSTAKYWASMPLMVRRLSLISTVSPGKPITRLTRRVSASFESKTTTSPRLGSANL